MKVSLGKQLYPSNHNSQKKSFNVFILIIGISITRIKNVGTSFNNDIRIIDNDGIQKM